MLMIFGDGNSFVISISIVMVSMACSVVVVALYGKKKGWLIATIADLIMASTLVILLLSYMVFNSDLSEPWTTQLGWFIRYNGITIGLFLGGTILRGSIGLSTLVLAMKARENDPPASSEKAMFAGIASITYFLLFGLLVFILSTCTVLGVLVFLVVVTLTLSTIAPLAGLHLNFAQETSPSGGNPGPASTLARFNAMLESNGVNKYDFWPLFIPLIAMTVMTSIAFVVYPSNPTVMLSVMVQGQNLQYKITIAQLLALGGILLAFLILPGFACFNIAREHLGFRNLAKFSRRLATWGTGALDTIKFLCIFITTSQFFYFYDYEPYYASAAIPVSLVAAAGAGISLLVSRSRAGRVYTTLMAVLLLLVNCTLIYTDSTSHAYNFWSGSFDVTFTYAYLFSTPQLAITGLAIGFLAGDLIHSFAFKHATDRGNSLNRSTLLFLGFFVGGMFTIPFNYLMDMPGGDVGGTVVLDLASFEGSVFYYFVVVLSILLVLVAVTSTGSEIAGWLARRKRSLDTNASGGQAGIHVQGMQGCSVGGQGTWTWKAKSFGLLAMLGISLVAGIGGAFTFATAYSRPVLVNSPGNYHVWLEDSAERVDKDAMISLGSSPAIDAVEMELAKNEYGAFQLVFKSLTRPVINLSCSVSDFIHETNASTVIPSSYANVRYEQRVINDTYADLLVPVTTMNLTAGINHVFYFSMKTPYDTLAGQYKGNVTLAFDANISETIDIDLRVWNFTVPRTRHLRTNIGGGSEDYALIDNYMYHRINDYGHGISMSLNETTNNWTFDWTSFDTFTQYKLDGGMNAFTVPYYMGGRDPDVTDTVLLDRETNLLKGIQDHLESKNWTAFAYIYFIDEFQMFVPDQYTREEYFARLAILLSTMKAAAPKIRIMTTTPPSEELELVRDYIDIFCPVTYDYDRERWEERKQAGAEFWMYPCVQPFAPWPNSHLYNRLYECRVLLWQVWHYQIDGFLYWSSQAYYHGKHGMGYNGYGDGWFVYSNGSYYDSLRWENYLDGQEDYEYVWLANATLHEIEKQGLLPQGEIDAKRHELASIVASVVGDGWIYADHPSAVYAGRAALASMLHGFSAFINTTSIGEAPWLGFL